MKQSFFLHHAGRAHCQKTADQLKAPPGAVEKLDNFITFIQPEPRAMLLARNTTQQRIAEAQLSYCTHLHDTMYTYFPGLCKNGSRAGLLSNFQVILRNIILNEDVVNVYSSKLF